MKNFYKLFFAVLLAAINCFAALADNIVVDGIKYDLVGVRCKVVGLNNKYETSISIPERIEYNNLSYLVTEIENLRDYYNLTSIELPNSITKIGKYAIEGCSSLQSINIPESVSDIGDLAFQACISLKSISIPQSINVLKGLFFNCQELETVNLPDGLISIESSSFEKCLKLSSIKIPEGVTKIESSAFKGCISLMTINIPEGVTILSGTFEGCSKLSVIELPKKLTEIGQKTFSGCSSLATISIPNNVTEIGNYAFQDCIGLTSITLPSKIEEIGDEVFNYCVNLKTVKVERETPATIGERIFDNCHKDLEILVPTGFVEKYKTSPGWSTYADKIKSFDPIKAGDKFSVGGITYEVIADGNGNLSLKIIDADEDITSVDLASPIEYEGQEFTITEIGDNAFEGCTQLTEVTIPENITKIGDEAFKDSGVTNVTFEGENPPTAGENIFEGCELEKIKVPEGSEETYKNSDVCEGNQGIVDSGNGSAASPVSPSDNYELSYNGNEVYITAPKNGEKYSGDVVIPSTISVNGDELPVTIIDFGAFEDCVDITSVTIPSSVTKIHSNAFKNCANLEAVYIDELSAWCRIDFSNETANPLFYAHNLYINGKLLEELVIPADISTLKDYTFVGGSCIRSLTLPETVSEIKNYTFRDCVGIPKIEIPNTITAIGHFAFMNCSSAKTITLSESLTKISTGTFSNCKKITSIILPDGLKIIEDNGFSGCEKLESIVLPDGLTTIGNSSFQYCKSLPEIEIPSSVTTISDFAFSGCSSLVDFVFPTNLKNWGQSLFATCFNLESVSLPDGMTIIPHRMFLGCSALKEIEIPKTVQEIGDEAFYSCVSLTRLEIPNNVKNIGENAFNYCRNLSELTLGKGVTTIEDKAFYDCINLKTIFNTSALFLTAGSSDYGYVAYYATKLLNSETIYKIYDGNSNVVITADRPNRKELSSPNALIFVNSDDEQTEANFVNAKNKATSIELTDGKPFYCPEEVEVGTLTYTREFSPKYWAALYVPFNMDYNEWNDLASVAYFNNIHQYDDDGDGIAEKTTIEYITQHEGNIRQNIPYMILPNTTGKKIFKCSNKVLAATPEIDGYVDCMSTSIYYRISGNYQTKTDMFEKGYYAVASTGGFKQALNSSVHLSPFRVYLGIENRSGAGTRAMSNDIPRKIVIVIDGEEIGDVEDILPSSEYYDLQGRIVGKPSKGFFIHNRKKVIIN